MTIATTSSTITYQGNGATTVWPFAFIIPSTADLIVQLTANGTTVTLNPSIYSATGIGNPSGGSVTYPLSGSPISNAYQLTISRVVPLVQTTDIENQSTFYPAVIEDALDYLTMQTQQLAAALAALPTSTAQWPPAGSVTGRQMRLAIEAAGVMFDVVNAIPADPTDAVNIAWTTGALVRSGDDLYAAIQNAADYTDAQMATLFAGATGYVS